MSGVDELYLNSKNEWLERYGSYIDQANQWKRIALGSLAIAAIAVVGVIILATQTKMVPYVVEVDKLGDSVAVQRADRLIPNKDVVVRSQLANWIHDVRVVSMDAHAQHTYLNHAYAFMDKQSKAYSKITGYYKTHDPFKRAQSETVAIKVEAALPISKNTWQVDWVETSYDRAGGILQQIPLRAMITIRQAAPSSEDLLLINPTGTYIEDINWSQRI